VGVCPDILLEIIRPLPSGFNLSLALELWTWFMGSLRTFRDQRRFVFLI
jgi:hypothetical protein